MLGGGNDTWKSGEQRNTSGDEMTGSGVFGRGAPFGVGDLKRRLEPIISALPVGIRTQVRGSVVDPF